MNTSQPSFTSTPIRSVNSGVFDGASPERQDAVGGDDDQEEVVLQPTNLQTAFDRSDQEPVDHDSLEWIEDEDEQKEVVLVPSRVSVATSNSPVAADKSASGSSVVMDSVEADVLEESLAALSLVESPAAKRNGSYNRDRDRSRSQLAPVSSNTDLDDSYEPLAVRVQRKMMQRAKAAHQQNSLSPQTQAQPVSATASKNQSTSDQSEKSVYSSGQSPQSTHQSASAQSRSDQSVKSPLPSERSDQSIMDDNPFADSQSVQESDSGRTQNVILSDGDEDEDGDEREQLKKKVNKQKAAVRIIQSDDDDDENEGAFVDSQDSDQDQNVCDDDWLSDDDEGDTRSHEGASSIDDDDDEEDVSVSSVDEREQMTQQLNQLLSVQASSDPSKLPDKGAKLQTQIDRLLQRLSTEPAKKSHSSSSASGSGSASAHRPVTTASGDHHLVDLISDDDEASNSAAASNTKTVSVSSYTPLVADHEVNDYREMHERNYGLGKHRLYGGKMTDGRMMEIRHALRTTAVKLHAVCANLPPEGTESTDPLCLTVPLKEHQRQGLAWMLFREAQLIAPGGILADDMGLGKTLSMISLILKQRQLEKSAERNEESYKWKKRCIADAGLVPSQSTLIVAPASVMRQWEAEIRKRVKTGTLSIELFHGNNRERSAHVLSRKDIVITTYGIVSSECGDQELDDEDEDENKPKQMSAAARRNKSVLLRVAWRRLVLDEAHMIKNHTVKQSKACCRLPAATRWALTGTPIHNKLTDFYSLLRLLRCSPFDEHAVWKMHIEEKNSQQARDRLNTLVKMLLLRRSKTDVSKSTGQCIVNLPPKHVQLHELEMEPLEANVYTKMFKAVQARVRALLNGDEADVDEHWQQARLGGAAAARDPFKRMAGAQQNTGMNGAVDFQTMSCVLVMLLRLRQASVHMALTKQAVDLEALRDDGEVEQQLAQDMGNVSFVDTHDTEDAMGVCLDRLFHPEHQSTKIKALMDRLTQINNNTPDDKCVVVSQWTSLLDIVDKLLSRTNIRTTRISGEVPPKHRQERVEEFNKKKGRGARVMLLSLTAGGVGLNLIGGNHLFMLDLHWNPALEQQACDRIYRMGQTKNVYIHKLICKNTIEQRVLDIQEKKLEMAKSVLEGGAKRSIAKLTLNDIRHLFALDEPTAAAEQKGAGASNRNRSKQTNAPATPRTGRVSPPLRPGAVRPSATANTAHTQFVYPLGTAQHNQPGYDSAKKSSLR